MNILVLGGGGREHAISWALAKSPRCTELYVAPGNGGTANIARNVKDLNAEDAQAVLAFAQAHNVELVVIGPEAPLVAGVAAVLREAGIPVFGPDAQGAQLEGYPGSYEKGKVILGLEEAQDLDGVIVFHAGTALNPDGELITAGGRVLNVVALGDTFEEARNRAYEACELIKFEGVQYRSDIGRRALQGRSAWE